MKVKTYSFWITLAAYFVVTASNDFVDRYCYACDYDGSTNYPCVDEPCNVAVPNTVSCNSTDVCFTTVVQEKDFEKGEMTIQSMTRGCVAEGHFTEGCVSDPNLNTYVYLCEENLCNSQDESSKENVPIEDCPTTPAPSTTTSGGNGGNGDSTTTTNNGGNGEGTTTTNDNGGSDDKTTTPNNNNGGNDNGRVHSVIVLVPLNILFAFLTVY